jgi:hypothetical protein
MIDFDLSVCPNNKMGFDAFVVVRLIWYRRYGVGQKSIEWSSSPAKILPCNIRKKKSVTTVPNSLDNDPCEEKYRIMLYYCKKYRRIGFKAF